MPFDHLRTIVAAQSVEQLWSYHTKRMAEYGFDRLIYGFTRFRSANSLGDRDDLFVLSNLCPEYIRTFVDKEMYRDAPMVRWANQNEGVCSWRELSERHARGELTPAEERVLEYNRSMGLFAGYTIAFRDISVRSRGAIGLVARAGVSQDEVDSVWAQHGTEILLMNEVMHLKVQNLPYHSTRPPLTPRQREVLEWVGDGKTAQDIATILGVTPATVEKHLRLARETLDVETTAQAVLKAWFQNQIFSASG
ncbi:LuxR family transcriptional regulator [Rhodovulum euryhalinum]|uniref:LuxR family transcriptional regulator n=1 Tax=Rhodovulum euryhalinum TaxID=35805 RepID=A0A4R2K8N1_9RHOB|nr:LuxR family transcriptional regulator [Rhodovulum euryhalinum]TCO69731.1 LuxR family transcriptional regulator [Rhodovulum euryhalinum]